MPSPTTPPKVTHFPGGYGQRRQVLYHFVPVPSCVPEISYDTQIIFVEDSNDPSKRDPDWKSVNSLDQDSVLIPNYLINKVLIQELAGCNLSDIKVFFVSEPDLNGVRAVHEWKFAIDFNHPIGITPYRTKVINFSNRWEQLLFSLGVHSVDKKTLFSIKSSALAGIFPVKVNIEKPKISGEEKKRILDAVGLSSEDVK